VHGLKERFPSGFSKQSTALDLELKNALNQITPSNLVSALVGSEQKRLFTLLYAAVVQQSTPHNRTLLRSVTTTQLEDFLFSSCLSLLRDIGSNHHSAFLTEGTTYHHHHSFSSFEELS
jgi:hypothetical protein